MTDSFRVFQDVNFGVYVVQSLNQILEYAAKRNPQVVLVAWQCGDEVEAMAIPPARVVAEGLAYEVMKMFEERRAEGDDGDEGSGVD